MNYEQKYKDTIERAKKELEACGSMECYAAKQLFRLFPELRGDEDEKIRKALVRFHKSTIDIDGIKGADILAWLEKQGESYTKNDVDDAYLKGISDAKNELEKQGTPAKLSEEEQNSFAKGVLSRCALSFIDYLDAHSYEGKMCVSNGECEDIDYAFHNAMWDRLHRYYCKYIEKQGEHQQLYIRFGDIPANEKSKIYRGEKEIGSENGVSVYPAFKLTNGDIVLGLNLPLTKTTLHTQQHLLEYDNRPCYLVIGDYIGNGADGEPLIRNVEIVEEIKDFRVKEGEVRYKINDSDSISVNGEPFDYEHATITQKDFAPKEGEQKPVLDFKASNFYVSKVDGKIHDITYNPADKIEPKFKVGDFIVNDYCMGRIIEITNDAYLLDTEQGIPFSCEHNVHLWTIQDAEEGDVLYFDDKTIVIFKDLYNSTTFHSYCHIEDGIFDISKDEMPDWWEGKGFVPATKEQRDTLFAKMKEAGYIWDSEKKELKKIELQPKPAWSEEDEKYSQRLENAYTYQFGMDSGITNWLKSIKDRVQPQPKQEWSDEDFKRIDYICDFIWKNRKGDTDEIYQQEQDVKWLKSLKDRVQYQSKE